MYTWKTETVAKIRRVNAGNGTFLWIDTRLPILIEELKENDHRRHDGGEKPVAELLVGREQFYLYRDPLKFLKDLFPNPKEKSSGKEPS